VSPGSHTLSKFGSISTALSNNTVHRHNAALQKVRFHQ
jgi:hypothetical protein